MFLAVITSATEVGNTRPSGTKPESVARIHEVSFYSLTSSTWDDLSAATVDPSLGPEPAEPAYRDTYGQPTQTVFEHPCMPLTKILSSGSFYYAVESQWDLSSRLAVRLSRDPKATNETLTFDERFVWNEYIIRSLLDFRERLDPHERDELDRCQFIVRAFYYIYYSHHFTEISLDIGNSRLRRRVYDAPSSAAHRWSTHGHYSFFDLKIRLETSRDQIQHTRR